MTPAGRLLIWRAAVVPHAATALPGTLVTSGSGRDVPSPPATDLLLPDPGAAGEPKAMAWEDFLRGARLGAGARVTELAA